MTNRHNSKSSWLNLSDGALWAPNVDWNRRLRERLLFTTDKDSGLKALLHIL